MKVRKKPVVVDAWRVQDLIEIAKRDLQELPIQLWEASRTEKIQFFPSLGEIYVRTLEGVMKASPDDWIICGVNGVNGELYPCKPDVFEKTYEKVE